MERFEGEARIADLGSRLAAELPGVLNWAIEGCLEWQRVGLAPPKVVTDATEEYRKEQDRFGQFLEDETERGAGYWESTDALYTAYTELVRQERSQVPRRQGTVPRAAEVPRV